MKPSTILMRRVGGMLHPADAKAAALLRKIPPKSLVSAEYEPPLPPEEWRPIAEYPGYEVSNLGQVRSVAAKGSHRRGVVLKPFLNPNGYSCVALHRAGKQTTHQTHILVAKAFLGDKPTEKHEIAHCDGDRQNPSADNLRWATRAENHADKLIHDTHNRGERHPMSRLTNQQAMLIIFRYSAGWSVERLSKEYGLKQGTIRKVLSGESWHWLPRPIKGSRKHAP